MMDIVESVLLLLNSLSKSLTFVGQQRHEESVKCASSKECCTFTLAATLWLAGLVRGQLIYICKTD